MFATLIWLASGMASAVPLTVTHQGYVTDALGSPINDQRDITVSIVPDGGGTPWTDTFFDVPVQNGYFAVVLGSGEALDATDLTSDSLSVQVMVEGAGPMDPQPMGSTPFAIVAGSLRDGPVDATRVTSDEPVVQPSAPAFCAYNGDGANRSTTGTYVANIETFERGGDNHSASTGRFTAPLDGIYAFDFTTYTNTTSGRAFAYVEGAIVSQTNGNGQGLSFIAQLSAGEQVWLGGQPSYPMYWYGASGHNLWCGHLVTRF